MPTLLLLHGLDLTASRAGRSRPQSHDSGGADSTTFESLDLRPGLLAAYRQHQFRFRHARDYSAIGVDQTNPAAGRVIVRFTTFDAFASAVDAQQARAASVRDLMSIGVNIYAGPPADLPFPDSQDWVVLQYTPRPSSIVGTWIIGTRGSVLVKIGSTCPNCTVGRIPAEELTYLKVKLAHLDAVLGPTP